jgi:hypothetical protein
MLVVELSKINKAKTVPTFKSPKIALLWRFGCYANSFLHHNGDTSPYYGAFVLGDNHDMTTTISLCVYIVNLTIA